MMCVRVFLKKLTNYLENPNNCIILNVTPTYQQGVAYLKFLSDRESDEP